jgi:hypothetical protein
LTLLFALEEQRGQVLDTARRSLADGNWERAVERAGAAEWIRRGEDVRRLRAVAHLLGGDFVGAWRNYRASE